MTDTLKAKLLIIFILGTLFSALGGLFQGDEVKFLLQIIPSSGSYYRGSL